MKSSLITGLRGEATHRVVSAELVSHFDPAGPPVFGSPFMLMLMEFAAFNAILPHLDAGEQSVGVGFDFEHLAATPAGAMVIARAEVLEIEGKRISFAIEAHDEHEIIGRGKHVRHVVEMDRFLKRLRRKSDR